MEDICFNSLSCCCFVFSLFFYQSAWIPIRKNNNYKQTRVKTFSCYESCGRCRGRPLHVSVGYKDLCPPSDPKGREEHGVKAQIKTAFSTCFNPSCLCGGKHVLIRLAKRGSGQSLHLNYVWAPSFLSPALLCTKELPWWPSG